MLAGNQERRLRQTFGLFPVLLAIEISLIFLSRTQTLPTSVEELRFYAQSSHWVGYVDLLAIFVSNAMTFIPLGQRIGMLFRLLKPLRAYSWDLVGSLAGTIVFGLFSFQHFSPIVGMAAVMLVYAALSPPKRWLWSVPIFLGILVMMRASNEPNAVWSPYYYIVIRPNLESSPIPVPAVAEPVSNLRSMSDPPIYQAEVNRDFYQHHGTIDPARYTPGSAAWTAADVLRQQYFFPYLLAPRHEHVLVLGAGGGMDVEAALLNGARKVDAVEIDPRLVELARQFNASGVFDNPRVTVRVNDARAFLRNATSKYDMVVFGYLDSQALFSYMTNVRIDGFIYTVESLRSAWRLVDDEAGALVLSFAVPRQWLGRKLIQMVGQATGQEPVVYVSSGGMTIVSAKRPLRDLPARHGDMLRLPPDQFTATDGPIPPATDDWPYLYLSRHTLPQDYLIVIGILLVISVFVVVGLRGHSLALPDWHFLFLGWGFLLLETKSIADCSLYFGTTWLVTTIVIVGVLLMVLAANVVAIRWYRFTFFLYVPLLASLIVLYLVPRDWVLSLSLAGRLVWAFLVVPLPIFFAGLVFSSTFRDAGNAASLFGANLVGAMIGGFCEYLGMAIGHHALMLLIMGAYVASMLCVLVLRRRTVATFPIPV